MMNRHPTAGASKGFLLVISCHNELSDPTMKVHLTRAATILPFTSYLAEEGGSVLQHLSVVGIAPELLGSPEALIPAHRGACFLDRSARQEGVENLGLEVGARTSIAGLGLFGMVLQQALTLNDLLQKLIKWIPVTDSGAHAWLEPADNPACVRLCIRHDFGAGKSIADDFALMILIDAVRMAAGPEWRPSRIAINGSKFRDLSGFEMLSEADRMISPDHASFLIPRSLLSAPVLRSRETPEIKESPEAELMATAPPEGLVDSISCAIRTSMESRVPTIDEAAEMVGTSVRSLQRGLGNQGTVYRELVDRVRYETACRLLGDPTIGVSEISDRLGYSNTANFSHAFLRWAGTPPSQFRRQCLAGERLMKA